MSSVLEASPGERLRTLRELLGLTGAELATLAGVSRTWISNAETGAREATQDGLQAVAAATDTPMSFFYARPSSVPLDSLRFRKLASASRTVTRRVTAFYGESFRVSDAMLKSAAYPTPPLPHATRHSIDGQDIEVLAAETRDALRLAPDRPIPHLTRALERAGIAVAPIVLRDPVGESAKTNTKHFGVSYWGGVDETALVGYFPGTQGDRDRFTLAHEIGHLVLHTFRPRVEDPEKEANQFASALLVPRERAEEDITDRLSLNGYARLKATWGVSIQALIMRGFSVGNISESRKRSLFVQLTQRGWRKQEPVTVGREDPLLLWSLLTREFGERPYLPASDALAIHPTVLRSIAPTPEKEHAQKPPAASTDNVVDFRQRRATPKTAPSTARAR